jgi:hypothetical protein
VPWTKLEILVRDGVPEVAFVAHLMSDSRDLAGYGPSRPAKKDWKTGRFDQAFWDDHFDALREAVIDYQEMAQGGNPNHRGFDPTYLNHPEGVPWSERDPGRCGRRRSPEEAPQHVEELRGAIPKPQVDIHGSSEAAPDA